MSPRLRLTAALRTVACGATLTIVFTCIVATPSTAAPPAGGSKSEVRTLRIPAVPLSSRQSVQADGLRGPGRIVAALPRQRTETFSTIGVTWAHGTLSAPQVEVRVRTNGSWSDWHLLPDDTAEGPNGNEGRRGKPGTAPLWVGTSDGVEVRVSDDPTAATMSLSDLSVSLVDPEVLSSDSRVQSLGSRITTDSVAPRMPNLVGQPAVVTRAQWGADERLRSYNGQGCAQPRYTSTIKAAIVHHTAGANSYSAASSAAQVRGIYAFHVKSRGWCDIGYNFLVDRYGTIFEGRYGGTTMPVHGAHATAWNTNTVGVSLMGNFDIGTPTTAMLDSTSRLLAWKLEGNYRNATSDLVLAGKRIGTIAGHGDVMPTACPGRNMRSRMDWLRGAVRNRIGSFNTPVYKRWQALGGEAGWIGSPFVGEHAVGEGRVTRFAGADLYYHPSYGTHWTKGRNRSLYRSLGETAHYLGWPTSDEVRGTLGSKMSYFQAGAIYYSRATRSQAVFGTFYRYYSRLGDKVGRLGLPLASQRAGAVKWSQVQHFQHGGLFWTRRLRTQEVNGAIYRTYVGLGAEKSALGMPTRGDYAVATGRATDFQGGRITWNATTGETTVTYR
jgi:uncharacterized protein with LGFP repeats